MTPRASGARRLSITRQAQMLKLRLQSPEQACLRPGCAPPAPTSPLVQTNPAVCMHARHDSLETAPITPTPPPSNQQTRPTRTAPLSYPPRYCRNQSGVTPLKQDPYPRTRAAGGGGAILRAPSPTPPSCGGSPFIPTPHSSLQRRIPTSPPSRLLLMPADAIEHAMPLCCPITHALCILSCLPFPCVLAPCLPAVCACLRRAPRAGWPPSALTAPFCAL